MSENISFKVISEDHNRPSSATQIYGTTQIRMYVWQNDSRYLALLRNLDSFG